MAVTLKLCFSLYQYFCADKSLASSTAIVVYGKMHVCVLKQRALLEVISWPFFVQEELCSLQLQRLCIRGMAAFEESGYTYNMDESGSI